MGAYYKGQRYGEFYENPDKNFIKFCESKTNYLQAFANSTIKEIPEFITNPNATRCDDMCNGATNLKKFNKKFDFSKITIANNSFEYCYNLENLPDTIDLRNCISADSMFHLCKKLKEIHIRNSSRVTAFADFARQSYALEKVDIIDGTACTNFNRFFYFESYPNLIHFRVVPNTIHVSFDFRYCPALDATSIQSIVDGLAEVTSAQTVTFNNAITLSTQQQQDIANKGWTLAFA